MLICTHLFKLSAIGLTLFASLAVCAITNATVSQRVPFTDRQITQSKPMRGNSVRQSQPLIDLVDGNYQFCSQPEPTDWHDGAGVCFNFRRLGEHVEGYYGYPHSDVFICIQGEMTGPLINGEAIALSWAGAQWHEIPPSEFQWDEEARLTLDNGEIIRPSGNPQTQPDWLVFHTATLNINGFYQYSHPRMTPPSELCNVQPRSQS